MNRQRSNSKVANRNCFPEADSSEKENNNLTVAKIQPTTRRVEQLLNDVRISACKTITNVKSSFEDMSQVSYIFGIKKNIFFLFCGNIDCSRYSGVSLCIGSTSLRPVAKDYFSSVWLPFTFLDPCMSSQ